VWWKAPKGLSSDVLCDACGVNWRKYADINVRPVREESVGVGKDGIGKRGGTPLLGPATKRARVGADFFSFFYGDDLTSCDGLFRRLLLSRLPHRRHMLRRLSVSAVIRMDRWAR
jgi:hypothetical protein